MKRISIIIIAVCGLLAMAWATHFSIPLTGEKMTVIGGRIYLSEPPYTYTKLLSHFDGTDGATTYTAETGQTISFVATAQLDTADKEFGTASLLLDGNSDYVTVSDSSDYDFGSENFTIDFWTSIAAGGYTNRFGWMGTLQQVPATRVGWNIAPDGAYPIDMAFRYYDSGTNYSYIITNNVSTGWHHLAFVKKGTETNDFGIAVDGAFQWFSGNFTIGSSQKFTVGREFQDHDGFYYRGWIDELRISKGIARWTDNFTPPTNPY